MSTSKAIKPRRDDAPLGKWEPIPERAPSIEREDQPLVARVLAMIGLFFVVLGTLAMVAPMWQRATVIPPGVGFFFASLGLPLILFHAFVERDFQFRRLYGFLGVALILGGVILRLLAFRASATNWFMTAGVPGMFIGLIFVVAVIRNETEAHFRALLINLLGILGAVMIAFGLVRGALVADYLPGEGIVLLMMGLLYVSAYIGLQETNSERSYKAAVALGAVGAFGFAVGLVFSLLPADAIATRIPWGSFFVPSGLILMGVSLTYVMVAVAICVDWPIVILARRDLSAYFFSPVAYLVLIGQLIFAWIMFAIFIAQVSGSSRSREGGLLEPIIMHYIISIIPVFVHMFFVPALTMRLVSEEQRTGTLEVLLTAPVNEVSVVLSKFIASWLFYNLLWLPWWLFLVSLRYYGNEEFDYRPILSFSVALAVISAGFMAMGVFCSSLTSNQIVAAVFTFVGIMAHLAIFFAQGLPWFAGGAIAEVMSYVNFIDLWIESLRGTIAPRYLVFHASLAFFFLFATVKVLESRKWK